jgi:hypothetical protein
LQDIFSKAKTDQRMELMRKALTEAAAAAGNQPHE